MDSSEARLDTLEAQRSTGFHVSHNNKRRPIYFPTFLINKGANMFSSLCFSQSGEEVMPPPKEDPESVPMFLTNFRLSDLYDLPGEYLAMNPEIFRAMRSGNIKILEKIKSETTPMACFKDEKGDSILHLAVAWGNIDLVKDTMSKCPSLLLDLNWKDQLPLHSAARAGHSAVVKVLVASVTYFSDRLSEEDRERLNIYVLKDTSGDIVLHLAMRDLHEKAELWKNQQHKSALFHEAASTSLMETAAVLVNADRRALFLANNDDISPLYLAVVANVSLVNAMLNLHGQTTDLASELEGKKIDRTRSSKNKEYRSVSGLNFLDVILNEDPSLVNERDEEGRTCLSVGAAVGFYYGICRLLDISTSAAYECDDDGSFPIHRAVEIGHIREVKEILKRCPGSECLVNKQGQNMLHIAAKCGKGRPFLEYYVKGLDKKKSHLIEEQDVDGNTPLHLATINWHPRFVYALTKHASSKTKIIDTRNRKQLRALDIAKLELNSQYIFRERLTQVVLLWAYKKERIVTVSMTGLILRSRSEHLNTNKFAGHINALLTVAALVAIVTFAAGFTIPDDFNSSAPNSGMDLLAKDRILSLFLVFDALAMQSSIISIVALIWAQLGDLAVVRKALILALASLLYGLIFMSLAFIFGILATIKQNIALIVIISILFVFFFYAMLLLLYPYVSPQYPGGINLPLIFTLIRLPLWFVNEDVANHGTSESVGSISERDQGNKMDTSI